MNNQNSFIAGPPLPAEYQLKSCPLCGTFNHARSRECFNCAWRGVFSGGAAACLQDGLRDKPGMRFVALRRQCLRAWHWIAGKRTR